MTSRNSPPPSSRRLRTSREVVPTFLSRTMQDLQFNAIKRSAEGRYVMMIAHEEPELKRFITRIAESRRVADLTIISETFTESISEALSEKRGFFFLNARKTSEKTLDAFLVRHENKGPFRMVIAAFPTEKALKKTLTLWPLEVRKLFHPDPLLWPQLKDRQSDFDGIIDGICDSLLSEDGRRQASLSPLARTEIKRTKRSVCDWYTTIKCAFGIMLRDDASEIELKHLQIARNASKRQEFFQAFKASTTNDAIAS